MGFLHKSAASIGFYGDDLNPAEITSVLGAEPTIGVRKGDLWRTPIGNGKVASTGSWRLHAPRMEPSDLDGQINGLLDKLTIDLAVWNAIATRFRGRAFCGLFMAAGNEGLTLAPTTLARIRERGLTLDLDIYGAEALD